MRVALSLLLICATTAAATADGLYASESFGGTDVKDQLASSMSSAFRIRFAVGYRHRNWAVEGWFAGALTLGGDHASDGGGYDGSSPNPELPGSCGPSRCGHDHASGASVHDALFTYGVDVKYLQPVARHVELYLRGGLSRGILDGNAYAGRGLGVGAGVQLKGKVRALGFLFWPLFFTSWGHKVTAAVFLEDGFEFYRLHKGGVVGAGSIDAQLNHLTLGFAVGSDF